MKTTHWNSQKIVQLLQKQFPQVKIQLVPPNGSYGYLTDTILLKPQGASSRLYLKGFTTAEDADIDPADADVEYVELTDGEDSSGGLNSDSPALVDLYNQVRKMLIKAKFEVVDSMEETD